MLDRERTQDEIEALAEARAAERYGIANTPDNTEFLRGTSVFAWARLSLSIENLGYESL
jgi:hypothetical protein